jgi:hypothetical protein
MEKDCAMTTFEFGDKVRVLRRAESGEEGWKNAWVEEMDLAIGQICVVIEDHNSRGVYLRSGNDSWNYPRHVLEKLDERHSRYRRIVL